MAETPPEDQNNNPPPDGGAPPPPEGGAPPPETTPPPPEDGTPPPPTDLWATAELDDALKAFIGEKSPVDVAKELQNAQALIGRKTVGIPTAESKPEEWAAYHKARGVPEDKDGYAFDDLKDEVLKDVPEDQRESVWDQAEEDHWREVFRSSNVSQTEANEIMRRGIEKRFNDHAATVQANTEAARATENLINDKWGAKNEEYSRDASAFFRAMGIGEDAVKGINQLTGVNPEARFAILEMARLQGFQMREGGQPNPDPSGVGGAAGMSQEQARAAKEAFLSQGNNRQRYQDGQLTPAEQQRMTDLLKVERGRT